MRHAVVALVLFALIAALAAYESRGSEFTMIPPIELNPDPPATAQPVDRPKGAARPNEQPRAGARGCSGATAGFDRPPHHVRAAPAAPPPPDLFRERSATRSAESRHDHANAEPCIDTAAASAARERRRRSEAAFPAPPVPAGEDGDGGGDEGDDDEDGDRGGGDESEEKTTTDDVGGDLAGIGRS